MKHEAVFQQISSQAGYYQMTNYPNVGGYSFAAYTYVSSHHICPSVAIYLFIKKKIKLKNNKKFQAANVKAIPGSEINFLIWAPTGEQV